jgi:hypothetical protein
MDKFDQQVLIWFSMGLGSWIAYWCYLAIRWLS